MTPENLREKLKEIYWRAEENDFSFETIDEIMSLIDQSADYLRGSIDTAKSIKDVLIDLRWENKSAKWAIDMVTEKCEAIIDTPSGEKGKE